MMQQRLTARSQKPKCCGTQTIRVGEKAVIFLCRRGGTRP